MNRKTVKKIYFFFILILFVFIFLFLSLRSLGIISPFSLSSYPHFAVLPHFMIDPEPVQKQYTKLAEHKIDKIILLSPNHFDTCQNVFCTIGSTQEVVRDAEKITMKPFTMLVPRRNDIVGGATGDNVFVTNDDLFVIDSQGTWTTPEHGIGEHIRFIRRYFPQAQVYPLVINPKRFVGIGPEEMKSMIQSIREQKNIAVIASVDFSHYVSEEYARIHDKKTEYTMYHSTGLMDFMQCEVDCPVCLRLIVNLARAFDQYPQLEYRDFFATSERESTSRQFFSFGSTQKTKNGLTLIAGGDAIYTRGVRQRFPTSGALFLHFSDFFQQGDGALSLQKYKHRKGRGVDMIGVNMESPLQTGSKCMTKETVTETGVSISFCSNGDVVRVLHDIGVTFATTANNHSFDYGRSGWIQTQELLRQGGIVPIGFDIVQTGKVRGIHYALHGFDMTWGKERLPDYLNQLQQFNQKGYTNIVMVHRGREYYPSPSRQQQILGHSLIDYGADVIIGSGPHVIQKIERYQGKPIVYSLGNFLFDQQYTGGIVMINIQKDTISLRTGSIPHTR